MPFAELLGALRRKWILLAIGLLLSGGLSAGSYMVTKPIYEITATVVDSEVFWRWVRGFGDKLKMRVSKR